MTKPKPILAYIAGPYTSDPAPNTVRALLWGQAAMAAGEILRLAYPDLWGGVVPMVPHITGLSATSIPTLGTERYAPGESVLTMLPGRTVVLPTPPESWWYDATMALLLRCDLLIVAGYTAEERQASVGTVAEIAAAEAAGIPQIVIDRAATERRGPTHDDVVRLADEMTALWRRGLLPRAAASDRLR